MWILFPWDQVGPGPQMAPACHWLAVTWHMSDGGIASRVAHCSCVPLAIWGEPVCVAFRRELVRLPARLGQQRRLVNCSRHRAHSSLHGGSSEESSSVFFVADCLRIASDESDKGEGYKR